MTAEKKQGITTIKHLQWKNSLIDLKLNVDLITFTAFGRSGSLGVSTLLSSSWKFNVLGANLHDFIVLRITTWNSDNKREVIQQKKTLFF